MTFEAAEHQISNKWLFQTGNKQPKENIESLGCFCINKIIGIRNEKKKKRVVQFLPSPTTTGYCFHAENNVKLTTHMLAIRKKKGKNISSNRKPVQRCS